MGLEPNVGASAPSPTQEASAAAIPERVVANDRMDWDRFDNHRRVQVVGAQYHQPALLTATRGQIRREGDRYETEAELAREPGNHHDSNAVQVLVRGKRIGYLKRGAAKRFNKRLKALEEGGKRELYPLLIRAAQPGFYQAHLQIPYNSELLRGYKNTKRQRGRMGLLSRLFGNTDAPQHGEVLQVESLLFEDCDQLVAAVGEASYQDALCRICGSTRWERVRFDCTAALLPEPENPYDSNAVRVFADCRGTYLHVGYLSRGDAVDYSQVVRKATELGYTITCQAHIAGREEGSETPNLGIFLDLPTPRSCLDQLSEPIS